MPEPKQAILRDYLATIHQIRSTGAGTGEISYYGALAAALNAIGARLRPRVFCVQNLSNRGAGYPDMGLFTTERGHTPADWPAGQSPERGVIEVDDIPADLSVKLRSKQVCDYLTAYGLVLVTNYRDFALLGRNASGAAEQRERFSFQCADATAFFALARRNRPDEPLAGQFDEFLTRVLLHQAPLARPEDVAFFLASYARDARARIERQASLPAFAELRTALQEALGLTFEGVKGEHLFRSTLVQTLFYGLFSAWVEVAQSGGAFDWRAAGWNLHVPFIDTLFQRIATPQHLQPLGLDEPLAWAAGALNRIDRDAFFGRFVEAEAVRYFYEPFLVAYDAELRREFGVWYTPREIVRYMVERVDQVLRTELGIADGLADESVWVLDPCCGTGAYLVEVLDRIRRTLEERGDDALTAEDLKRAAMTRVAGFEIMAAPYVIAHWQIGHALRAAGAPLQAGERAAVYLTNALTGWAPPQDTGESGAAQHGIRYTYPPLADERDEAARVKRARPILVVLGNPPYNAFAGTSPAEEAGLVEPYKEGLREQWGVRKYNLDDPYVRFFRIAERRIAELTGRGVVCYISNHSWVSYPSFVVMRSRLLREFDRIWIDELHGDRKSSERGPDGRTSETIFAVQGFSPGIRQGTAIALLTRTSGTAELADVFYSDRADASRAADRRAQLLAGITGDDQSARYVRAHPATSNRFTLLPSVAMNVAPSVVENRPDYASWQTLPSLSELPPFSGVLEKRRGSLMSLDRDQLALRMRRYFDPQESIADLRADRVGPAENMARFDAVKARARLLVEEPYSDAAIRRIALYPFETRWAYHTSVRPVWNEPRPELALGAFPGNAFLVSRLRARRPGEGIPLVWTTLLPGDHLLDPNAHPIPVLASRDRPNLSALARDWLAALGIAAPSAADPSAFLPWHHALAIVYAPAWLAENADGIRQDWPRVPLPRDAALLQRSAALGAHVAALLDTESPVPGVTSGHIETVLKCIAVPSRRGSGTMTEQDRAITAGWGHFGNKGVVMGGRGNLVTRPYGESEALAADAGALLGAQTHDVFLNADAYWRNVPEKVWQFTIGGYQVLRKYLSYREYDILGRALTPGEVRGVRDIARRLAALRLMGPALDENYRACATAHWQSR